MKTRTIQKFKYIFAFLALFVLFGACINEMPSIAEADSGALAFDKTYVLDDLNSAVVGGVPFDLSQYPEDKNGKMQLLCFVEFGYSARITAIENYGLYVYLYNPQLLNVATGAGSNKIQMCSGYNEFGDPGEYAKFDLRFCSKSAGEYNNRFYKYRVVDKKAGKDNKTIQERAVDNVDYFNGRRYDVSGFELITYGSQNADEYGVGGSFIYNGYGTGMGEDTSAPSTLVCEVKNIDTIKLDVEHTNFRTGVSSAGKDHYNDINTAYFTVPNSYFEKYGYLNGITPEWWEYRTKPAMITSNIDYYKKFLPYTKIDVGEKNGDDNIPVCLSNGYDKSYGTTHNQAFYEYDWSFNIKNGIFGTPPQYSQYSSKLSAGMVPYAFYSPKKASMESIWDFMKKQITSAGDVKSNVVADWIYKYTNELGNGYIDCNGRQISKDLVEPTENPYFNKTIYLNDTFDLNSYMDSTLWWQQILDYGLIWRPTDQENYKDVAPIYIVKSGDLDGTPDEVSKRLLIGKQDVNEIKSVYKTANEKEKKETLVLFRFASRDYFAFPVSTEKYEKETANADTYVAQENIFLDFDIIDLRFMNEGQETVIAAVSSPKDIINGFDPPRDLEYPDWLQILVKVLIIIAIVIACVLALIIMYFVISFILKLFKSNKSVVNNYTTTAPAAAPKNAKTAKKQSSKPKPSGASKAKKKKKPQKKR